MKQVLFAGALAVAPLLAMGQEAPAGAAPAGANGNAFNPAMSVILNAQYAHHSLAPDDYVRAGFPLAGEAGPGAQGLSIGESEVSLAANIDEKFYGQLTLSAESEDGTDHVGVEEAFVDTTALPAGFTARVGRFFSDIGYLNSHHAHTDNSPIVRCRTRPSWVASMAMMACRCAGSHPPICSSSWAVRHFAATSSRAVAQGHSGVGVTTLFAHAGGDLGVEIPGSPACRCCTRRPMRPKTASPASTSCTSPTSPGSGRHRATPRMAASPSAASTSSTTAMAPTSRPTMRWIPRRPGMASVAAGTSRACTASTASGRPATASTSCCPPAMARSRPALILRATA